MSNWRSEDYADEDTPVIIDSLNEAPEHHGRYVIEIDHDTLAALLNGKLAYQTVNSHEYTIVVRLKMDDSE
jgi:hypothetical protein